MHTQCTHAPWCTHSLPAHNNNNNTSHKGCLSTRRKTSITPGTQWYNVAPCSDNGARAHSTEAFRVTTELALHPETSPTSLGQPVHGSPRPCRNDADLGCVYFLTSDEEENSGAISLTSSWHLGLCSVTEGRHIHASMMIKFRVGHTKTHMQCVHVSSWVLTNVWLGIDNCRRCFTTIASNNYMTPNNASTYEWRIHVDRPTCRFTHILCCL